MFGPRSTGSPQGASMLARCETQTSGPPRPPGRGAGSEELMYRLRPSLEIAGLLSLYGELTTGPRLTGADQADQTGALFTSRGSSSSCSDPRAVSRYRHASRSAQQVPSGFSGVIRSFTVLL